MEHDMELLNYIYQNAKMGADSISYLLNSVEDKKFKKVIEREQKEYQKIAKKAEKMLKEKEENVISNGILSKVTTYMMIKANMLKDSSIPHIALLMVKGSNMGIIDISKNLNRFDDISAEVSELANELLESEQMNVEELKPYL